jgi:hypothetical protein
MKMALGFSTETSSSGSKFLPVVKFDAKAGEFIAVNRTPGESTGTWDKEEVEIALPTKVVMEMAELEVGWISFVPTYSCVMVKAGEKLPPQPSADHKHSVRVKLFFKDHGLRELTPTSKTVLRALDQLHDQYLAGADKNAGKMPVVTIHGTETKKVSTPQGELRFKIPKWEITGWTDAPAGMKGEESPKPAKAAPAKAVQPDDLEEF